MKRVKVDLFGKRGQRTTEVTPQGFPTRPVNTGNSEPATITPNPKTPSELRTEQVTAVIPAYTEAYSNNRDRLLTFLSKGFGKNLSQGVILHELGNALETEYAPRKAMTAPQWYAWISDLHTPDYSSVDWIASLQTRIYRKYEDLRPPRPFTEPEGKIKVYIVDGESPGVDMLIYGYPNEHKRRELIELKWRNYASKYNCTLRIETPTKEYFITADEPEKTEVA